MKEKVNIVCVYWKGDFRTRDFCPQDVCRLYVSISKHMERPFDFFVFTNDMEAQLPGTKIELMHSEDWEGWWAKMEMFRPAAYSKRRTLYMDLDSHVIKSLEPLFKYKNPIVMFPGKKENSVPKYRNATILFDPEEFYWMHSKFMMDSDYYIERYRGDQDLMSEWLPNAIVFPKEWMIKMIDVEKRFKVEEPPPEVIIVTGQPRSGLFRKTHEISWLEKKAR